MPKSVLFGNKESKQFFKFDLIILVGILTENQIELTENQTVPLKNNNNISWGKRRRAGWKWAKGGQGGI